MKLTIYFLYSFFMLFFNAFDVKEDVITALKSGKASELVKYFEEKVTIKLITQEDVLSKSQAEANLKYFFDKHSVKSFTETQTGSSINSSAQYLTGSLETSNGKFRVSILIKRNLISQFRIETDND